MTNDVQKLLDDPYQKMRQQLLARFVGGEVDRPAYEKMLAEIETLAASDSHPRATDTPRPVTADTASREPATRRHFESIGNVATARDTAHRHAPGERLGDLCLESRIGRGGMGEVWKAFDQVGDRHVVVKVLPPELQDNDGEMARVKTTFQHVHALQHQHICPVYALGNDPAAGYYLVMKYIDGTTLMSHRRNHVEQHGAFPLNEVVRLLTPIAEALDYAHSKKIVHRDIKPQNILVCPGGADVQLVDFGLAAEIRTSMTRVSRAQGDTSGTYPYMAPEQWKGEHQDGNSDQYALAVVAYELLSGRLPFEAPDAFILRQCALHEPPPHLEDQPDWVNSALAKGLAKSRAGRFATCAEFTRALAEPGRVAAATAPQSATEPAKNSTSPQEPAHANQPAPVKEPESAKPSTPAKAHVAARYASAAEPIFEVDPDPPQPKVTARPVQRKPEPAPRSAARAPAPAAPAKPQVMPATAQSARVQSDATLAPSKWPRRFRNLIIRLVILGGLVAYIRSTEFYRTDLPKFWKSFVAEVDKKKSERAKADGSGPIDPFGSKETPQGPESPSKPDGQLMPGGPFPAAGSLPPADPRPGAYDPPPADPRPGAYDEPKARPPTEADNLTERPPGARVETTSEPEGNIVYDDAPPAAPN